MCKKILINCGNQLGPHKLHISRGCLQSSVLDTKYAFWHLILFEKETLIDFVWHVGNFLAFRYVLRIIWIVDQNSLKITLLDLDVNFVLEIN
jgi:hypothetical protein